MNQTRSLAETSTLHDLRALQVLRYQVLEGTLIDQSPRRRIVLRGKNVGHFYTISAHDPFQSLVVPEHAHILT